MHNARPVLKYYYSQSSLVTSTRSMHYCSQHNVDEPKEFPKVLRFLPPEAGEHLKKSAKTIEYGTSVGRVGTEYSDEWLREAETREVHGGVYLGKELQNSLENIAFRYQCTTDHDSVGEVLRVCLPKAKLMLSFCMCELSLLWLRSRTFHFSERVCVNMPYFKKSWHADCYYGYLTGSNLLASFICLNLICVPLSLLCGYSAFSRICP